MKCEKCMIPKWNYNKIIYLFDGHIQIWLNPSWLHLKILHDTYDNYKRFGIRIGRIIILVTK